MTLPIPPRAPQVYDSTTRLLHWATALLVVGLWLGAQVIDAFPRGAPRTNMRSVHMLMGVMLAAVLLARVTWRKLAGVRLPAAGHPSLARLSTAVHVLLYVLLIAEVLLGLTNAWARGDSVFNLFAIPAFTADRALRRTINEMHALVANAILVVAGLHAAAALVHHYVWKDDVLRRMLPARMPGGRAPVPQRR